MTTARPRRAALASLAEHVRQITQRHAPPADRCPTGWPRLDAVLGGGLPRGATHELIAGGEATPLRTLALRTAANAANTVNAVSTANTATVNAVNTANAGVAGIVAGAAGNAANPPAAIAHTLAAAGAAADRTASSPHAASAQRWIMYFDADEDLYPPALALLGAPLDRLLIVRPPSRAQTLWAAEQALRCRSIAAVVLAIRGLDGCASRRLQLAAESGDALALLLRPDEPAAPTFAHTRLRVDPLPGSAVVRRVQITLLKLREGRPGAPFALEVDDAPHALHSSALLRDRTGPPRDERGSGPRAAAGADAGGRRLAGG